MPMDPDECRQRALECVRMAQTTKNQDARKVRCLTFARTWLVFAADLEADGDLLDQWGEPDAQRQKNFLIDVGGATQADSASEAFGGSQDARHVTVRELVQ